MKIRALTLRNFRKFTGTVEVRGFGDGVNVLAEPNEFGKSTLLAAINGVVFERYKSQTQAVRAFQHSRNQTVPEVRLEFEVGGGRYAIHKRFACGSSARALLEGPGGRRWENDAAEKKLQELLGFTSGARSAEAGIWGTLWVEQAGSLGEPPLDERSRSTIQDCLEAEVGAIAGGRRGREIPQRVEAALDELVSQRGPRGRYREAIDRRDELKAEALALAEKREQHARHLESLAQLQAQLARRQAAGDEEADRKRLAEAREERTRAAMREARVTEAKSALQLAEARLDASRQELEAREHRLADARRRSEALLAIGRTLDEAAARRERLAAPVGQADAAVTRLRAEERAAADEAQRWRRIKDAAETQARIERARQRLAEAARLEGEIARADGELAAIAVTAESMEAIAEAVSAHAAAQASLRAVATRVELELEPDALGGVTVDGVAPAAQRTAHDVIAECSIAIRGVGSIRIAPRIEEREVLVARERQAAEALGDALAAARCHDAAEARRELARREALARSAQAARAELKRLLPADKSIGLGAGADTLRQRLAADEARLLAELRALDLAALPAPATIDAAIASEETRAADRRREATLAEKTRDERRKALVEAERELAAAEASRRETAAQLDEQQAALAAERAGRPDAALRDEAEARRGDVEARREAVRRRREEVGETVEDVDGRIERLERVLAHHRAETDRIEKKIIELEALIRAGEGLGLDEKIEEKRGEAERLDRTVEEFAREVEVLRLLLDTLRDEERKARERYLSPVVRRVEPYLRLLLPQARILLSEEFRLAGLERNAVEEEFGRLSQGTQEQLAVLARLAFAEMLLDQGRPAMVILDDALVFSDDDRMERMFDVLTRAGRKMQILVLTCRQRVFAHLGVGNLDVRHVPDVAGEATG